MTNIFYNLVVNLRFKFHYQLVLLNTILYKELERTVSLALKKFDSANYLIIS